MSTKHVHRLIVVVPVEDRETACVLTKSVDRTGGERTFSSRLSPDGAEPATHLWCDWNMTDDEMERLKGLLVLTKGSRVWNGHEVDPDDVLKECGLSRVQANPMGGGK